jgi:hypothetical protein
MFNPSASGGAMDTVQPVKDEATLGALLRSLPATKLPAQFYQLLQLAIPFAFQFWSYGWYRTAGWMIVTSLFGVWALCVQHLEDTDAHDRRFVWQRIGRTVAKSAGGTLAAVLLVEGFVRFLSFVFRCPGCAG